MRTMRRLLSLACALTLIFSSAHYCLAQQSRPLFQLRRPEILNDTKGVDACPYAWKLAQKVGRNWNNLIPRDAMPPLLESGTTKIEFVVLKDGSVRGMKLVDQARNVNMDRAAWGGITSGSPFARFPDDFKVEFLALRLTFLYNPKKPVDESPCAVPSSEPKDSSSGSH
jgi:hypothetical protein